MRYLSFSIFFCLLIFFSCKSDIDIKKSKENHSIIEFAEGFDIQNKGNVTKLIINSPYQGSSNTFTYTIVKPENTKVVLEKNLIQTPIQRIILTSTTHIPMVELLGEENSIIGFPHTNYVSSLKTRKRILDKKIIEIGKEGALNTEIVLDLNPDLVVGYSVSGADPSLQTLQKSEIPVIYNGDWLEPTPLGRAEWIKFFGLLFNKEALADSIFNKIKNDYLTAKEIANQSKHKFSVLSGAVMGKDIWNLPAGDSFVAQFLKDANLDYIWKDTKGRGSLSLSFESVYEKGKNANFWIAPGYFSNKKQMLHQNKLYQNFEAFQKDQIYTPTTKKGNSGGVLYYEMAPSRPDLVLKDIIKVTRPNLLKDYNLTFFEKMK